jgi:hypothetical protein
MPLPRSTNIDAVPREDSGPRVLETIIQPETEMAVWQRAPNPAVVDELAALGAEALGSPRAELSDPLSCTEPGTAVRAAAAALLLDRGVDPSRCSAWLADIDLLGTRFLQLTRRLADAEGCDLARVRLRLETLGDDGCPRFHVDRCRLRLLCTYRGPGTEWLPGAQVDRSALASHAPNERILRYGEPRRLQPFHVGVMKGECYPGNAGRGLVHRSPSIAGSGQTRVLVCLDV